MEGKQSLYLILLLLAALVFGPVVVLTQDRGIDRPLKALERPERIMDAPASLPGSRSPLPDGRGGPSGLPVFPR